MKGKTHRTLVVALILTLSIALVAGCAQPTPTSAPTPTPQLMYWDLLDKVADSSDLPDWTGPKLTLKIWDATGTGNIPRDNVTDPIVRDEISRVTGVTIDYENSFDNKGQDESYLELIAASGEWPDIVIGAYSSLKKLIENDKLWDLTAPLAQYAPWMEKRFPKDSVLGSVYTDPQQTTGGQEGRIYAMPSRINVRNVYTTVFPGVDMAKWSRINPIKSWEASNNAKVYVRDDLLKAVRPEALTLAELQKIYEETGSYTEEQIFDVHIRSMDDYLQLLRDLKAYIDANDIKEGGKKVMVGMANEGSGDAYALLACLIPSLKGMQGAGALGPYWSKGATKLQFRLPTMKDDVKDFWQLVQEDVWSKESLINNTEVTRADVDNGLYATLHVPWMGPDNKKLAEAGKSFRYRKLNIEIPFDTANNYYMQGAPAGASANWAVVKENIDEQEMIQIVRFYNYCLSDTGEKVLYWGPRSAGLWKEEGGKRTFVSEDLTKDLVYRIDTGLNVKYGLSSGVDHKYWLNFPMAYGNGISLNNPRYTYDSIPRSGDNYEDAYTPAYLKGKGYWKDEYATFVAMTADFWNFEGDVTVAGTKFTLTYNEWNQMVNACLAAKTEADFNAKWDALVQFTQDSGGMSEAGLDEETTYFLEKNKEYLDVLGVG